MTDNPAYNFKTKIVKVCGSQRGINCISEVLKKIGTDHEISHEGYYWNKYSQKIPEYRTNIFICYPSDSFINYAADRNKRHISLAYEKLRLKNEKVECSEIEQNIFNKFSSLKDKSIIYLAKNTCQSFGKFYSVIEKKVANIYEIIMDKLMDNKLDTYNTLVNCKLRNNYKIKDSLATYYSLEIIFSFSAPEVQKFYQTLLNDKNMSDYFVVNVISKNRNDIQSLKKFIAECCSITYNAFEKFFSEKIINDPSRKGKAFILKESSGSIGLAQMGFHVDDLLNGYEKIYSNNVIENEHEHDWYKSTTNKKSNEVILEESTRETTQKFLKLFADKIVDVSRETSMTAANICKHLDITKEDIKSVGVILFSHFFSKIKISGLNKAKIVANEFVDSITFEDNHITKCLINIFAQNPGVLGITGDLEEYEKFKNILPIVFPEFVKLQKTNEFNDLIRQKFSGGNDKIYAKNAKEFIAQIASNSNFNDVGTLTKNVRRLYDCDGVDMLSLLQSKNVIQWLSRLYVINEVFTNDNSELKISNCRTKPRTYLLVKTSKSEKKINHYTTLDFEFLERRNNLLDDIYEISRVISNHSTKPNMLSEFVHELFNGCIDIEELSEYIMIAAHGSAVVKKIKIKLYKISQSILNCFEFNQPYGCDQIPCWWTIAPDIIIDKNGNPKMLEINTGPVVQRYNARKYYKELFELMMGNSQNLQYQRIDYLPYDNTAKIQQFAHPDKFSSFIDVETYLRDFRNDKYFNKNTSTFANLSTVQTGYMYDESIALFYKDEFDNVEVLLISTDVNDFILNNLIYFEVIQKINAENKLCTVNKINLDTIVDVALYVKDDNDKLYIYSTVGSTKGVINTMNQTYDVLKIKRVGLFINSNLSRLMYMRDVSDAYDNERKINNNGKLKFVEYSTQNKETAENVEENVEENAVKINIVNLHTISK